MRHIHLGDVYMMYFTGHGSVQSGWRPGVVFQNNFGNRHSPNIVALPITSSIKRLDLPTHVFLSAKDSGLKLDGVVLCENPATIDKRFVREYLTTLSPETMAQIAVGQILASSAIVFLDVASIKEAQARARKYQGNQSQEDREEIGAHV